VAGKDLPLIREVPPKLPTAPKYLRASAPAPDPIRGSSAAKLFWAACRTDGSEYFRRQLALAAKQGLPQMNPGSGPGQALMLADISYRPDLLRLLRHPRGLTGIGLVFGSLVAACGRAVWKGNQRPNLEHHLFNVA